MFETQSVEYGILNQQAPAWKIDHWIDERGRPAAYEIDDFKGKVIYLLGFQSWCPGSYVTGIPTLKSIKDALNLHQEHVEFLAVQTAFEALTVNSEKKLFLVQQKHQLHIPIGHQKPIKGDELPLFMKNYQSGGTPWVVIIDKQGKVAYNDFHIETQQGIRMMKELIAL